MGREEKHYGWKTIRVEDEVKEDEVEEEIEEKEEKYYGWKTIWDTDPDFYYLTPISISDPEGEEEGMGAVGGMMEMGREEKHYGWKTIWVEDEVKEDEVEEEIEEKDDKYYG